MYKKQFVIRYFLGVLLVMNLAQVTACSPFSTPDRTADPVPLPPEYSMAEAVSEPAQRWWETFDDPTLTNLVEEALRENQDLLAFWARVEKARAQARKAGSERFPSVTGDADASYAKFRTDNGSRRSTIEAESYSLGIFASYEVDLWGRVAATTQAAELITKASREDLNSAAMTIAAEVARRWIGIVVSQRGLMLLKQQLDINQTYLELVELRFRRSLASALDVTQQKQLVERVRAQIPLAEMQEQLLRSELAVLTGRVLSDLPPISVEQLPVMAPLPAAGIPSQLLYNRPDIRAGLYRLQSADQNLLVAKADRLPALRLTGSAAYENVELDRFFDNWLLNLAAGLTAPLIDGGRRRAEVDISAAEVQERLALYRQTVLAAVQEVEASLIREEKIREHVKWTEKQLQAANNALVEARNRYRNGLNDYLPVLTQLLSVQNLEIDLIERKEDLFDARISLYRAVGGTWTGEMPAPDADSPNQQDEKS